MQEQINAVQRMQDYIAEHICEKISFTELAKVSLFSLWYARRLFLEFTGFTPEEYIRKFRLILSPRCILLWPHGSKQTDTSATPRCSTFTT